MIKAFVIASFSFASISILFFFWMRHNYFLRFGILCAVIFAISVFTGNKYVAFLVYIMLSVYIIKTDADNVIYFYLALLPVFPLSIEWLLSLPGIDTLFILNHNRILILCLLGPLFLRSLNQGNGLIDRFKSYSGVADRLILCYLVLQALTNFRDLDTLVAARSSLVLLVDIWLPYYIISRNIKNVDVALVIFVYTAAMLAVLTIIEERAFFRIYDTITYPMGEPFKLVKIRDGRLRTFASMGNPLALGFFFALAFLVAFNIRKLVKCSFYIPWVLCVLIILGMDATGSRSPLASNFVGLLVLVWWFFGRRFVRKTAAYAFIAFILFLIWFFSGGVNLILQFDDDGGTFYYRYELILNSLHIIQNNLLLGSSPRIFLNDPILLRSLQGEGIIDLTNTYLFITLKSGILAFFAFVGVWFTILRGLYSVDGPESTASTLMAVSVSTMFMLFISSPISFVGVYFWILIALCIGFIRTYSPVTR